MRRRQVLVKTGDVFYTHTDSLLGFLIRWAETDPGERPSWASHTGVVLQDGDLFKDAVVIEAVSKVRKGLFQIKPGSYARVYRPIPALTEEEKRIFREVAENLIGKKYGWWKLLFHLADRVVFKGKKVLSRLLFIDSRPICSYLAAHLEAAINRSFGVDPDAADPDNMMDYSDTHPKEWEYLGEVDV